MAHNPNPWRSRAVAATLAATAFALPLASCGGGNTAAYDPNSPLGKLQVQVLALENAQQENQRLMGQALAQNAQMRDDVATALARNRELEQRLAALETRPAAPEPAVAAHPVAASPEEMTNGPRRIPVAVRMPENAQAPTRPTTGTVQRLTVNVRSGEAWQPLYSNTGERSRKVRVKRVSAGTAARIRLAPAGANETSGGPPQPTWSLPDAGAEKWLRIGCGQQIAAQTEDAAFEVLIRDDRTPDICPAKSAGVP